MMSIKFKVFMFLFTNGIIQQLGKNKMGRAYNNNGNVPQREENSLLIEDCDIAVRGPILP